jgi:hypothetical protein
VAYSRDSRDKAGASADREYARRRSAREERARRRFGKVGVVANRLAGDPQHVRSWKKGAEGERHVAKRLEKLLNGGSVQLLHDRRVPGSVANIDHLSVGPAGVMVIDAKNLKGKIEVRRRGGLFSKRVEELRVGGWNKNKLIDGVERQISVVQGVLDAAGFTGVAVNGALCIASGENLPFFGGLKVRGIRIDGCRRIAKLARQSGPLETGQIDRISEALDRALKPA